MKMIHATDQCLIKIPIDQQVPNGFRRLPLMDSTLAEIGESEFCIDETGNTFCLIYQDESGKRYESPQFQASEFSLELLSKFKDENKIEAEFNFVKIPPKLKEILDK